MFGERFGDHYHAGCPIDVSFSPWPTQVHFENIVNDRTIPKQALAMGTATSGRCLGVGFCLSKDLRRWQEVTYHEW